MKPSGSNSIETLKRWASAFDEPRNEHSPKDMELIRSHLLQRLKSYLLKLGQQFNIPPNDLNYWSLYSRRGSTPPWVVKRVSVINEASKIIGDKNCPESVIDEIKSMIGISGKELEDRLRVITSRYSEMPDIYERAMIRPLMQRMLHIVGHRNCPTKVVSEFLALVGSDRRKLGAALESLLRWKEIGIIQTEQVLQTAKKLNTLSLQETKAHIKKVSSLVERRDKWMKIHGFETLSFSELDTIPTAKLLHAWNNGNNAFNNDDREVLLITLRKRSGIDSNPTNRFTVCPRCSLVGAACTCHTYTND